MPPRVTAASMLPWYRQAPKLVAAAASTGAACVSVLTFLYSFGVIGDSDAVNGVGSFGVARVTVRPAADTARAIGDTLHLAATITDRNGAVVLNTGPAWSSDDPSIASVEPDGSVIARAPGATTVTVAVGSIIARSRIVVRQRVATVDVVGASAGGNIVMSEGERRVLQARARDARGHVVAREGAAWQTEDTTIAMVDSTGAIIGDVPGRTRVAATVAGITGHLAVHVVASPANVALVAGDTQHVEAGRSLPQPVVVRVMSRRGVPMAGVPVRFRSPQGGPVDPVSAMTDAEGRARATWTLGERPGRQQLLASADGVDSALVVTAEADPAAANTRVTVMSDGITGVVGTAVAEPIAVHVTDTTGRLLGDVPVRWLAVDGDVTPLAPRTDSLGAARATWTLGGRAGAQRVQVQVGSVSGSASIPAVSIRGSAAPGAPRRLVVASGDRQSGAAGTALGKPVVFRVLDSLGNRVPDAQLVISGLGVATADSVVRADSTGRVSIAWSLGRMPGTQRLLARIPASKESLVVTAVARPAPSPPVRQAGSARSTKAPPRRGN